MSYNSIAWLPLALGLTVLGLILSYMAYRRRGLRSAMMGTAWSLLPIAAYLTGAIEMLWKVGVAIGQFGTGFVFSPMKWAGIGVTGLAVALFLAAGGRARRKASREARRVARADRNAEAEGSSAPSALGKSKAGSPGTQILPTRREQVPVERPAAATSAKGSRKAASADDDDMKDIEDILRKRGILYHVGDGCHPIRRNHCVRVKSRSACRCVKKISCSKAVGPKITFMSRLPPVLWVCVPKTPMGAYAGSGFRLHPTYPITHQQGVCGVMGAPGQYREV